MSQPSIDLHFDPEVLLSLVGGRPVLNTPRLRLNSLDEASAFLKVYGYDWGDDFDRETLWSYHARAVTYIRTQLLTETEEMPEQLTDPKKLGDVRELLILASQVSGAAATSETSRLAFWACAILRVMHVTAHLNNDLFSYFSNDIQEQIFKPYNEFLQKDPHGNIFLKNQNGITIPLKKFDMKQFKNSDSAITKLLAKPEEVAFGLLDKMGVRFVTPTLFEGFCVMRFLIESHVISFPHVIPDQANNTLYPTNLFLEVIDEIKASTHMTASMIDELLKKRLHDANARARYKLKPNPFTGQEYRFIKFITRQLVRVRANPTAKPFMFFYPYEVQIIDYETYVKNLTGPSSHDEYKARQRQAARRRVLGAE